MLILNPLSAHRPKSFDFSATSWLSKKMDTKIAAHSRRRRNKHCDDTVIDSTVLRAPSLSIRLIMNPKSKRERRGSSPTTSPLPNSSPSPHPTPSAISPPDFNERRLPCACSRSHFHVMATWSIASPLSVVDCSEPPHKSTQRISA